KEPHPCCRGEMHCVLGQPLLHRDESGALGRRRFADQLPILDTEIAEPSLIKRSRSHRAASGESAASVLVDALLPMPSNVQHPAQVGTITLVGDFGDRAV